MRYPLACALAFAVFFVVSPHVGAGERMRYLEIINRAHDRVTSVWLAPAGSHAYRELLLGEQVRGGGAAATVQIVSDHCLHDVLVEFNGGRRALYPEVDICRHHGLRLRPLPATGRPRPAMEAKRDHMPIASGEQPT